MQMECENCVDLKHFESYRFKCTSIAPERRILPMYIYIAKLKTLSKFGDEIYLLLDCADM
jgi:hypothetical protein